jgi:type IV secretion system protein VirB10
MKVFCLPLLLSASVWAADIPPGTHVLLRMVNSINTRTAREGDYVYLRTATPILSQGGIVAPAESYVQGVVSHSKPSGRVSGRAELGIRLETLTLAGGKTFKFAPRLAAVDAGDTGQQVDARESAIKQGGTKEQDIQRIAITAGSGAAIGGLADRSWRGAGIGAAAGSVVGIATVLLTRGREVDLHQGMTLDVVFDRSVPLE